MGDIQGFMKYDRVELKKQSPQDRKKHYNEFITLLSDDDIKKQAARCMDCGTPFCHWACPLGNTPPDFNDMVYRGQWKEAADRLLKTNSFPEITGRICPALCENSCVMTLNQPAVSIRNIELTIIEKAFENGWVKPVISSVRTGKKIAVVGSGPSGLAVADRLNKFGHNVTVFEKNEGIGGILVFGIPDFKLEKRIVQRRVDLMKEEGIEFKPGVFVGVDISVKYLLKNFDAVVLTGGAESPRDLKVEGRDLQGIYQAMDYLTVQNRLVGGKKVDDAGIIDAKNKRVVVLGGGDTGSDCVGTANRQGAKWVKQFEIMPEPPKDRPSGNPWPQWALIKRVSSSHEEGVSQEYCVSTKKFSGSDGILKKLHGVRIEFGPKDPATGRAAMKEIAGSDFEVECDLVFLALGFLGPVKTGMIDDLGVSLDERGNVKTGVDYMTSVQGVFSAGDMRTGQSLVVRAISEGNNAAEAVNKWLSGKMTE